MRTISYIVEPECDGREVGSLLRSKLHLGRQAIRRAKFTDDGIMLDGERVKTIVHVRAGQTLSVVVGDPEDALEDAGVEPVPGPLDIVFEDDDLILLNKPAGLATHPGPKHAEDTLSNYLAFYFQQTGQRCLIHPVQRLDWGTSGLLIFAKNAHAQDFLQRRLHTDDFTRTYLAFCERTPSPEAGTVEAPIGRLGAGWSTSAVVDGGRPATTHYQVLATTSEPVLDAPVLAAQTPESPGTEASSADTVLKSPAGGGAAPCSSAPEASSDMPKAVSLVKLQLETGRTHQIRIHMAHIGCPLLGDPDYGGSTQLISRPALHSAQVAFIHPVTEQRLEFSAPFPDDLQRLSAELHLGAV